MSLLDDVSIVVTPNGYKAGELYAVIPVPTEGAEEIVNGDFATDTDWTKGTGWSISGGTANCNNTSGSTQNLKTENRLLNLGGKRVQISFTVSNYSGSASMTVTLQGTGGNDFSGINANGTYTTLSLISPTDNSIDLLFKASNGWVGSIDNVSVKEYTSADMDVTRATSATRVDENGLVNYAEILGSEEVTNGDFELNSDWNNFSTPTTSEQSTEQSHTGTYSWKVIADATQEGIFSPNNFSITNGNSYSVSLWIYSVSGNSIKSGLNNTNVTVFTERTVIAGQWTNITYEATATSTGASYISILSQNSLQFFVDNVSVKEVTRDNVPRIDYTGGGCPHILAEPQRTNLITYSSDFSQWSSSGGMAVTLNNSTSPSGDVNATLLVTSNANDVIYTNVSSTIASTFSVYVKWKVGSGNIDLSSDGGSSYTSLPVTEGWTRISISPIAIANQVALRIPTSGSELWVWGAQLEEGSYGTSYIPTSGSTVTRNQDQFTRDGIGSLINSTEGVLFVEMAALSNDGTNRTIALSDGTGNNLVRLYFSNSSNRIVAQVKVGGSTQVTFDITGITVIDFNKVALKYKENDFSIWINGVERGTDTSGTTPTSMNRLALDNGSGSENLFGKVKQLQVYKTALTDAQLTSLTS